MFATILVAIDGSRSSARALETALSLAAEPGARLIVCSVADDAAHRACRDAAERARKTGIDAEEVVVFGRASERLLAVAAEREADAIVIGTHAESGLERLVLGSTTVGVLHGSTVPVIVVPPYATGKGTGPWRRLLAALDDSEPSDAAFAFAFAFARGAADLVLCNVLAFDDLYRSAARNGFDPAPVVARARELAERALSGFAVRAASAGVVTNVSIVEGSAAKTIVAVAAYRRADAIVIGTHGRRGFHRMFLGSVAEVVARSAPVPVVVVRRALPQWKNVEAAATVAAARSRVVSG